MGLRTVAEEENCKMIEIKRNTEMLMIERKLKKPLKLTCVMTCQIIRAESNSLDHDIAGFEIDTLINK